MTKVKLKLTGFDRKV